VKAGPKSVVDGSPLRLRGSGRRELTVARFATDYVRVPRGHGARKPLRLRPWQRERTGLARWTPTAAGSPAVTPQVVASERLAEQLELARPGRDRLAAVVRPLRRPTL
jgi:hypothetical protein